MTTVLIFILFILAGIYCVLAKTREEEAAIREGRVSAEHIEIKRIKRKLSLLSIIAGNESPFPAILFGALVTLCGGCCLFIIATLPFVIGANFNTYGGKLYLGIVVGTVALPFVYGQIHDYCKRQSNCLKNKLQFLEEKAR